MKLYHWVLLGYFLLQLVCVLLASRAYSLRVDDAYYYFGIALASLAMGYCEILNLDVMQMGFARSIATLGTFATIAMGEGLLDQSPRDLSLAATAKSAAAPGHCFNCISGNQFHPISSTMVAMQGQSGTFW